MKIKKGKLLSIIKESYWMGDIKAKDDFGAYFICTMKKFLSKINFQLYLL